MTRRFAMRGYTLIEIMVVVALIALAATAATIGLGSLTHGNLRSSAMMVGAGVRAGYGRAATHGKTVRLVLDLDENQFWLEESDDRVVLDVNDETGAAGAAETEDEEEQEREQEQQDGEQGEQASVGLNRSTTLFGAPQIDSEGRRRARFTKLPGNRGEPRSPRGSVRLHAVYTGHQRGRQEAGRQYLYFFPGGMTERSVIQIADSGGDVYSISVHPLTGRARVDPVPVEPERDLFAHEVEEEGEPPR